MIVINALALLASFGSVPTTDPLVIGELKYGYKIDQELDTIVGQLNDVTKKVELFDTVRPYEGTFYDEGSCFLVITPDELPERFAVSGRSTPRTSPSHVKLTVKTFDKDGKPINKVIEALNNGQIIRDVAGRELGDGRKFKKDDSEYGGFYQSKDGKGYVKIEFLTF